MYYTGLDQYNVPDAMSGHRYSSPDVQGLPASTTSGGGIFPADYHHSYSGMSCLISSVG